MGTTSIESLFSAFPDDVPPPPKERKPRRERQKGPPGQATKSKVLDMTQVQSSDNDTDKLVVKVTTIPPPFGSKFYTSFEKSSNILDLHENMRFKICLFFLMQPSLVSFLPQVFKQLVDAFKRNDQEAIYYFQFVVDPTSFGRTVENVFYVSFLVKEGKVKIFYDEETRLPKIVPVKAKRDPSMAPNEVSYKIESFRIKAAPSTSKINKIL